MMLSRQVSDHAQDPSAYTAEFRRQMIDLVRSGRDPTDRAREVKPSAQAIRNWVVQADRSEGRREDKTAVADLGPNAAERDERARLRREDNRWVMQMTASPRLRL